MNKNSKEKSARIEIRTTPQIKKKIERYAKKCGLSLSEYVTKKALGYAPREALPDSFYLFYQKICELCNLIENKVTPDTENKLLELIDDIHDKLLLPGKETDALSQQQAFGPLRKKLKLIDGIKQYVPEVKAAIEAELIAERQKNERSLDR